MKKEIYIVFGVIALLLSCGAEKENVPAQDDELIEESIVEELGKEEVTQLINGEVSHQIVYLGDTSLITFEYAYYSQLDSAYKDSVNAFIVDLYTRDYCVDSGWESTVITEELFSNYLQCFSDDFHEYANGEDEMIWSLECQVSIDDSHEGFVEISHRAWSYEGGAHGNGYSQISIIDKEDGGKLKLEDFFTDLSELAEIAKPFFRDQNMVEEGQTLEEAGYEFGDAFYLCNNFSIYKDGLYVYYDRYEIGPYAMPPSEVMIPMAEIQHLLKRDI
ncbi:MAG: RsiV family protein [Crocinitomicaceae bacterium]|nr:RsiV family protein [Crocinitomicaceae bacterium]